MPMRVGRMGSAFDESLKAGAFITTMSDVWNSTEFHGAGGSDTYGDQYGESYGGALAVIPGGTGQFDTVLDQLVALIRDFDKREGGVNLEARFHKVEDVTTFSFVGHESETGRHVDLGFDDGIYVTIRDRNGLDSDEKRAALPPDHPSRWYEPITVEEFGSLEVLIGDLQALLDASDVDDETRIRVQGAIDILRGTQRAAVVGETRRTEILHVVREVVRFMTESLPKRIVLWGVAMQVLQTWYPSVVGVIEKVLG